MKHIFLLILSLVAWSAVAQNTGKSSSEADFYELKTITIPDEIKLEVGGLAPMPDGRLAVCTRRGEVWIIENPYQANGSQPHYSLFAKGLHEALGLAYKDGSLYCTQRGELTKLTDTNEDGKADIYEPVTTWDLSGNYHEYSYGPVFDKNGDMYVTLNVAWVGYGEGKLAKWRGWLIKVKPDGKIEPIATGLRSPAGFTVNSKGDVLYGENQGDWVGSGRVTHLEKGDFAGNAGGLWWTKESNSPMKPTTVKDVPDTGEPMHVAAQKMKELKLPAVWFPHSLMGISTADVLEDETAGKFGPFEGQYFVADQGHSKVMRMTLEKVKGKYQGACFPFREGWASGLLRLRWANDGSLYGGMTSRGWGSTGKADFALQRLVWNGKMPFEMKDIKAMADGFEIEFTKPVDKTTAENVSNYELNSFTYKYHHVYGSPIINNEPCKLKGIIVSPDRMKVRLIMDTRQYYIHEVKAEGVRSESGEPLLHTFGYYTLNNIPEGERAALPMNNGSNNGLMEMEMNHTGHTMTTLPKISPNKKMRLGASTKRLNTIPADWNNTPDAVITIGTKPALKFDTEQVEVKAGSKVKLIFNNNDNDMTHNLVIVSPGTVDEVGNAAMKMGLKGSQLDYVPNSAKVLFHTALIQPDMSETIYFVAPSLPGNYTFVCTYPGHHSIMQGTFKVVK